LGRKDTVRIGFELDDWILCRSCLVLRSHKYNALPLATAQIAILSMVLKLTLAIG